MTLVFVFQTQRLQSVQDTVAQFLKVCNTCTGSKLELIEKCSSYGAMLNELYIALDSFAYFEISTDRNPYYRKKKNTLEKEPSLTAPLLLEFIPSFCCGSQLSCNLLVLSP